MNHAHNEEDIFLAALEIDSPHERAGYLDDACRENAELRGRVQALLRRHQEQEGILDAPPPGLDVTNDSDMIGEKPGMMIGAYKLLEQIGEGGFGVVFLAEQERPVRRRVAMKIIKPGMDTRQVIGRFEAERQALAMMDHPNIAKVFDAGATETGRPYFVMELVQGVPITEYCDECNLTTRERLELLVTACQAVQHAHQKGVIHRDIKPNNVLVAMQDGRPAPKIIDFGVAKAINQRLTDQTLVTGFVQTLGTPLYMSPEQAELNPLGVDTRSDIYSLGVLLYELLTGTTPFDKERLHSAPYDELCRIIREEDPPRPSARISTLAADLATTVAGRHRTDSRRLRQMIRGDLDWIVMKCLDKDRNRRYETPSALDRDIQRYLHDEPVAARPPSAAYRLHKFARRHKAGLAIATVVIALAASMLMIARQRSETETQRRQAEQVAEEARQRFYANDIRLAFNAWTTGDLGEVLQLLERHRPSGDQDDLRGFEWYYLWQFVHGDPLTLRGHKGEIYFVTFSPDGKRLATASQDGSVRLWDATSGETVHSLYGHIGEVTGVSFSPDGKRLASAGDDRTVRAWDAVDGKELAILRGHTDMVFNAVFSPDGKLLASGGSDNLVKLWDTASWQELATLRGHAHDVEHLAFSPDGKLLATAGGEDFRPEPSTVRLWNVATRTEMASLLGHRSTVFFVAFSPDGRSLASASEDRTVKLWDLAAAQELRTLRGHTSDVHSVAFSPDGETLASASRDGTMRLWEVASGRPRWSSAGHAGRIWSVTYSPDGQTLATAGADRVIGLWDLDAAPARHRLPIETELSVQVLLFDGKWLATIGPLGRRTIEGRVWDAANGAEIATFDCDSVQFTSCVAASPTSATLALYSGGFLQLLDVASDQRRVIRRLNAKPPYIAISPHERLIATSDYAAGAPVKIWNAASGQMHADLKHDVGTITSLAFSPDGWTLAGGGDHVASQVWLWDTATGKRRTTLIGHDGSVVCVAFSSNGKTLATASSDSTVRLWDARTHRLRAILVGHTAEVHWAAFSPDNKTLATASEDRTVRLWHVATGQEFFTLEGHSWPVDYVAFYPDGRRLLSVGRGTDGRDEFYVWSAAEDGT